MKLNCVLHHFLFNSSKLHELSLGQLTKHKTKTYLVRTNPEMARYISIVTGPCANKDVTLKSISVLIDAVKIIPTPTPHTHLVWGPDHIIQTISSKRLWISAVKSLT